MQILLLLLFVNPITVGAGTLFIIGQLSKWFQLVESYGYNEGFNGSWLQGRSVVVNGISFNRCIDIGQDADYLYLRPTTLVDLVCKPVRIPWTTVKSVRPEKVLWADMLRIQLSKPDVALHVQQGLLDMKNPYLALDTP